MTDMLKYALSGAAAGAANGLFGAGGGMVLIPLLTRWAGVRDKTAFAASIAIVLPLCLVSAAVCYVTGGLDVTGALSYLLGGFFGGLLGGSLLRRISGKFLHRALGLVILWGGIRCLLG